jgi:hypothetical protein
VQTSSYIAALYPYYYAGRIAARGVDSWLAVILLNDLGERAIAADLFVTSEEVHGAVHDAELPLKRLEPILASRVMASGGESLGLWS